MKKLGKGFLSLFLGLSLGWSLNLAAAGPAEASRGLRYLSFPDQDQGQPVRVNLVEVNLDQSHYQLDIAMAKGQANTVDVVSNIAKRHQAVAAINGSFFHGTTTDSSVGLVLKQGEIIADSGHRRTSLGITADGKFVMGIPQIQTGLYFADADRFQAVSGVNQPRKSHQTIVYTPRFGAYTHTNEWGREVVVENHRVVRYSYGNTRIPDHGFIISVHGAGADIAKRYPVGTYVELSTEQEGKWADVETVITGAPQLVRKGKVYNTYFQEHLQHSLMKPNARTAVGYTHNHKLLLVNVLPAQGNKGGGITYTRLAQIMRRLGAYEAMALDGGGSTSLYVAPSGDHSAIKFANRPVTNALIIKSDAS